MKAAELRQSILQAAVQGKLVSQNPQDEPASELLKRIQQEKARLVKESKLKKEKPLPPITEDEIPFDLPEGWVWCRLGEIGFTNIGLTYKPSDISEKGVPVLRSGNIQNSKIDYSNMIFVSCNVPEKLMLQKGDILICARNGSKRLVGKSAIVQDSGMSFGAFMAIFRSSINSYVHIFLQSPAFFQQMHGNDSDTTTINQITQNMLKNALFPLAPVATQQRIIDKLDKLMTLCDEIENEERKLDGLELHFVEYLPKAILQTATQGKLVPQNSHDEPASELLKRIQKEKAQLVKECKLKKEKSLPPISEDEIPYDLPEGWEWCRLRDIGQIIGGATPDSHESGYYTKPGQGISWLTPADMTKYTQNNFISHGAKDITQAGYNSCSTTLMPPNSIIFSSRAPIGHIAFSSKAVCTNQGFKSVVPYMAAVAPWIFYALKSKVDDIQSRASGTTFKEVSGKFMESEIIPLPPLVEQQRITQKVDELIDLCNELKDTCIAPMPLTKSDNIIPFPTTQKEEETLLAARGDVGQLSNEAMQAIDDLFAEDEE